MDDPLRACLSASCSRALHSLAPFAACISPAQLYRTNLPSATASLAMLTFAHPPLANPGLAFSRFIASCSLFPATFRFSRVQAPQLSAPPLRRAHPPFRPFVFVPFPRHSGAFSLPLPPAARLRLPCPAPRPPAPCATTRLPHLHPSLPSNLRSFPSRSPPSPPSDPFPPSRRKPSSSSQRSRPPSPFRTAQQGETGCTGQRRRQVASSRSSRRVSSRSSTFVMRQYSKSSNGGRRGFPFPSRAARPLPPLLPPTEPSTKRCGSGRRRPGGTSWAGLARSIGCGRSWDRSCSRSSRGQR